ncbi:MAG: 30S ribosomal protein S2 [Chloroflexi bacterium HGW-Chloroflexi-2]|jgi:small subunit ribosomal protein S2|nr:MAG: 30S ribosomal protein S2 [Chloroflexi bacterium HGW-Chloroflexi-2]
MASVISMKALLESGVHFGHRTNKWHPGMRPFIFTERNGIHILDLQQTVKAINSAYNIVRDTVAAGGTILFVGTKRQAQETIKEEAMRCGMPYVTERWLGGTLTNWSTISQRIGELERLERLHETGEINSYTKKEALMIDREINRLMIRLSGVRNMKKIPDLLFIIDVSREETAVHEANLKGVPIIAMVDTNCDPRNIDHVIPSNDDAIRAIKLMVSKIADAVIEGKSLRKDEDLDEEMTPGEEKPVVVRRRMEEDAELADETLLGASTLAKLDVEKEEEVTEEVTEEVAEEVSEEETDIVVEDLVVVKEEEVIVKKPATKDKKTTKAKVTKKAETLTEVVAEDVEEDASVESEDLDEE